MPDSVPSPTSSTRDSSRRRETRLASLDAQGGLPRPRESSEPRTLLLPTVPPTAADRWYTQDRDGQRCSPGGVVGRTTRAWYTHLGTPRVHHLLPALPAVGTPPGQSREEYTGQGCHTRGEGVHWAELSHQRKEEYSGQSCHTRRREGTLGRVVTPGAGVLGYSWSRSAGRRRNPGYSGLFY